MCVRRVVTAYLGTEDQLESYNPSGNIYPSAPCSFPLLWGRIPPADQCSRVVGSFVSSTAAVCHRGETRGTLSSSRLVSFLSALPFYEIN